MQKIKHLKNDYQITAFNDPFLDNKLQRMMQIAPQTYNSDEDKLLIQALVQYIKAHHTISTTKLTTLIYNSIFKTVKFKELIPFNVRLSNDNGQSFTLNYMDPSVRPHLVEQIAKDDIFDIINNEESLSKLRKNISTNAILAYLNKKSPDKKDVFQHLKRIQFNSLDDQMFGGDHTNQIVMNGNKLEFKIHVTLALSQFEVSNNLGEKYYQTIINELKGYPLNISWFTPKKVKVGLYL